MDETIKTPDIATLEGWFFAPRMVRYAGAGDAAEESARLDGCVEAIRWVASAIDPAAWVLVNSRVAQIRRERPE